jgi:uncharacterized MnhB-related membrane protein
MSMQRQPILLGLLIVGAATSLTMLIFRLFGPPREEAFYGACLTTALSLYLLSRHLLRRK